MRGFFRIAIKTKEVADLQQYCHANERMSTLLERHEPTFAGKLLKQNVIHCLHLFLPHQ